MSRASNSFQVFGEYNPLFFEQHSAVFTRSWMKICMILFASVVVSLSAQARLGETFEQITTRYGQPVEAAIQLDSRQTKAVFRYHDFSVEVTFLDERSQAELFKKPDGTPFTTAEVATILQANAFGKKWELTPTVNRPPSMAWVLAGGIAFGNYLSDESDPPERVSVSTKQYKDYLENRIRDDHKDKLNGL